MSSLSIYEPIARIVAQAPKWREKNIMLAIDWLFSRIKVVNVCNQKYGGAVTFR
jgi:hypothetical protein